MERLLKLIHALENRVQYASISDAKISSSPVGWHIDHTLLTANFIITAVEKSNPSEYKSKFTFGKLYVFTLRKIPRGRAQSPKAVRPKENFTIDDIKRHFEICETMLERLPQLGKNNFFVHPFFGHLNLKPTIRFLEIHTQHHLNIIDDILMAAKIFPS